MHRNSQKRIYFDEAIYFITFNTIDGYPYFKENIFCEIFMKNLNVCKQLKQFELYAFNILHNHVHLLLKPGKKYNISKIIKSLKENVSCDINRVINVNDEGATPASRLRIIYKKKHMNFEQYQRKYIHKYGHNQYVMPQFKWQKSFHDHVIRNEKDFENHYNYTINNHLKHNLSENWKYTSVNYIKSMLIKGGFNHTVIFLSGEEYDIEIYDRINKRFE